MSTSRCFARVENSPDRAANRNSEARAVAAWEPDILRAARACARRRALRPDDPLADDAAQEARLAVALVARRGVVDERYVRRAIGNSVKNAARQTLVVSGESTADDLDQVAVEARLSDALAANRVRAWLARQPRQFQAVYDLLYREGLSQREAAERLGVSQPRVAKVHRDLLARGRDDLRALAA